MSSPSSRADEWEMGRYKKAGKSGLRRASPRRASTPSLTRLDGPPPARKASGREIHLPNGHSVRNAHLGVKPITSGSFAAYIHRTEGREEEREEAGGMDPAEFEALVREREAQLAAQVEAGTLDATRAAPVSGIEFEFPYDLPSARRGAVMRATAAEFEAAGFRVTWAVHSHNSKGEEHPHGHLAVLVKEDGTRPIEGGAAMKAFREAMAKRINAAGVVNGRAPRQIWHFGTLAETRAFAAKLGAAAEDLAKLDRSPRPDLPAGWYRAAEVADRLDAENRPVPPSLRRAQVNRDRAWAEWQEAVKAGRPAQPAGWAKRRQRTQEARQGREDLPRVQEELESARDELKATQKAAERDHEARLVSEAQRDQADTRRRRVVELAVDQRRRLRQERDRARRERDKAMARPLLMRAELKEVVPAPVSTGPLQQPSATQKGAHPPPTTSPKLRALLVPANDAKAVVDARKTIRGQDNEMLKRQELMQVAAIQRIWEGRVKLDPQRVEAERQVTRALNLIREEMAVRAMSMPTRGQEIEAQFRTDLRRRQQAASKGQAQDKS